MSQVADRVYVDRALISYVRQIAEALRAMPEHVAARPVGARAAWR